MSVGNRAVSIVGWTAFSLGIVLYFSFIDQIILNISGNKGSWVLPLAATVNATSWALYGFLKTPKDYPMLVCNLPGIVLCGITTATAFL